jgi:hypothetical protein
VTCMVDQKRGEHAAEGEQYASRQGADQIIDELRQLLDAAAVRAEEYLHDRCAAMAASEDARDASCGWCPVCAVVSIMRGQRPELTARLAEHLAVLVALLRELLAEHQGNPSAPPPDSPEPATETKVQHIDVRRVNGHVLRETGTATEGCGC